MNEFLSPFKVWKAYNVNKTEVKQVVCLFFLETAAYSCRNLCHCACQRRVLQLYDHTLQSPFAGLLASLSLLFWFTLSTFVSSAG